MSWIDSLVKEQCYAVEAAVAVKGPCCCPRGYKKRTQGEVSQDCALALLISGALAKGFSLLTPILNSFTLS